MQSTFFSSESHSCSIELHIDRTEAFPESRTSHIQQKTISHLEPVYMTRLIGPLETNGMLNQFVSSGKLLLKALLDGSTFTKNLAKSINYLHVSIMKRVACPLGVSPIFSVSLSTFYVSNRIGKLFTGERCFYCRLEVRYWFSIEE